MSKRSVFPPPLFAAAMLLSLQSAFGQVTISPASLLNGTVNAFYSQQLIANPGAGYSTTWSLDQLTSLPVGLTLSSQSGVISGTPTVIGTTNFYVRATFSVVTGPASGLPSPVIKAYQITVASVAPAIDMTYLPPVGGVDTPYTPFSFRLLPGTGTAPLIWFSTPTVPAPGLTFSAAGVLSGTPTQVGTFPFFVDVRDAQGLRSATAGFLVTITAAFSVTTTSLPPATVGAAYATSLSVSGGRPPYIWRSTSGTLPPGIVLNSSGTLSGTPTTAGTFTFNVQAVESGQTATAPQTLTIVVSGAFGITTPSLPNGIPGAAYSASLVASGGTAPLTWSITKGALPTGVSLNSITGVLSGLPTTVGVFNFTVQVRDANGVIAPEKTFTAAMAAPLTISSFTLPGGTINTAYSTALTVVGGIPPYAWSLLSGTPPTGVSVDPQTGVLSGTPAAAGSFSFVVQVKDSLGTLAQRSLALTIANVNSSNIISVLPMSLEFAALASGDVPAPKSISLIPSSNTVQSYTVQTDSGSGGSPAGRWLTVQTGSGTAPARLTVMVDQTGLAAGTYTARIRIGLPGSAQAPIDVMVSLTVTASPQMIEVSPTVVRLTAIDKIPGLLERTVLVRNAGGGGGLSFQANIVDPLKKSPWLIGVTPAAGQTTASKATVVRISVDPLKALIGNNRGVVRITSAAGNQDVSVILYVSPDQPVLRVTPTGAQFEIRQGSGNAYPQLVSIGNSGSLRAPLLWTAEKQSGGEWLNLSAAQGTVTASNPNGQLVLSLSAKAAELPANAYYAVVRVSDSAVPKTVRYLTAVLNVLAANRPPTPNPSPQGLIFRGAAGGVQPAAQTVKLFASSTQPVAFQASASTVTGGAWLSVKPTVGTTSTAAPADTTVSVSTVGLAAGIYRGEVDYSIGGSLRATNVTLIVGATGATVLSKAREADAPCTSNGLVLTHTELGSGFVTPASWPTILSVNVQDNCGSVAPGAQVTLNFDNGDSPYSADEQPAGQFTYSWIPQKVSTATAVTATATAPQFPGMVFTAQILGGVSSNTAPTLSRDGTVHNFNPLSGESLAPGVLVAIYGANLAKNTSHPNPVTDSFEGTEVLIGGILAPLFYVSPTQINAQVPVELLPGQPVDIYVSYNNQVATFAKDKTAAAPNESSTTAVTAPDTLTMRPVQPGVAAFADGRLIAQHNRTEGLILVTPQDPAVPGEVLTMYLLGLGDTSPKVGTGAMAPSAEPLARVRVLPVVTFDSVDGPQATADLLYAGLVPGSIGLYQVNFLVPANAIPGTLDSASRTVKIRQLDQEANTTTLPLSRRRP